MINDALTELLSGVRTYREIATGLRFQYREPDKGNPTHRLFCYRVGNLPTNREFTAVRQRLEAMRPQARIELLEPTIYKGKDGRIRHGRAFSWQEGAFVQAALFQG